MTCEPTPARDGMDIPGLREKYRREREKRIHREGQEQYIRATGDFAEVYESDPYTPFQPRDPLAEDIDVAVLGAGWSGILAGYHLKRAGITNFRTINHAGDFGGVWYWNRYPGLQCDNDAYAYLPLLEEMGFIPSKKFEDGYEIRGYAQSIARRFGLYPNALFHTLVKTLRWDEAIRRWRISTDRDRRHRRHRRAGDPLSRRPCQAALRAAAHGLHRGRKTQRPD